MYWTDHIKKLSKDCKNKWEVLWEMELKLNQKKRLLIGDKRPKGMGLCVLRTNINVLETEYEFKKAEIFELDSQLTEIVKRYEKSAPLTIKDVWKI